MEGLRARGWPSGKGLMLRGGFCAVRCAGLGRQTAQPGAGRMEAAQGDQRARRQGQPGWVLLGKPPVMG